MPEHCSFCSVWRTDGQKPRQRGVDSVVSEIMSCGGVDSASWRSPTTTSIRSRSPTSRWRSGRERGTSRAAAGAASERFELMARLAELPHDMVFTQITMEAAEDELFLDAMRRANIKGAPVGGGRHP
jgi:hypothetical protein